MAPKTILKRPSASLSGARKRRHVNSELKEALTKKIASILLSEASVKELVAIEDLADDVLAWCVAHGVVMYKQPAAKFQATMVPVTLLPSPIAGDLYNEVMNIASDFHKMMDNIAVDVQWLKEALEKTRQMDETCKGLLQLCEDVYGPGKKDYAADIRLHIMRNDFMLDTRAGASGIAAKQIELNMMAASFSTHCQDLIEAHRYVLMKYLARVDSELTLDVLQPVLGEMLPSSPNAEGIARAMAEAHNAYCRRWTPRGKPRVVLFVSTDDEKNELDHRKLEVALFKNHGVTAIRRSLPTLSTQRETLLESLGPNLLAKALIVDGHEVSVAYFRSGYWPDHFQPLQACWEARKAIEVSEAAKCPSAPAQLAGMKKVQQMLCTAETLKRFVPSETVSKRLRATFSRQGDPSESSHEAGEITAAAIEEPSAWVMKPQVEGSGELLFGEDIAKTLRSRSKQELAEFILMERVFPAVTPSAVCRMEEGKRAEAVVRRSVSELGIFGTFLADGKRVLLNEAVGHLLRSKGRDTNQGGVFVGNAVVDAPLLVPPEIFWPSVTS